MELSAEVVLRPESGESLEGARITTETLARYKPPAAAAAETARFFSHHGFTTGAPGGISFTITAPTRHFEEFFGVTLDEEGLGQLTVRSPEGSVSYELPLKALPPSVSRWIEAVTFTPAPDFGPVAFF
jgi:hypothetical protein